MSDVYGPPAPGPSDLPPPWGTGPALPDSVLRVKLATGGWNHLTSVMSRVMPRQLYAATVYTRSVRRAIARKG